MDYKAEAFSQNGAELHISSLFIESLHLCSADNLAVRDIFSGTEFACVPRYDERCHYFIDLLFYCLITLDCAFLYKCFVGIPRM